MPALRRLACLLPLLAAGCTDAVPPADAAVDAVVDAPLDATGPGARGRVGPAGGTLAGGGVSVVVPPGALDREVELEIAPTTLPIPAGYRAYSVVYRARPEGLTFARPLVVAIEFAGDASRAQLHWSRAAGGGYESLGGTATGNLLTAAVQHFSTGFVGAENADGGDGADAANDATPPADLGGAPMDAAVDRPDAGSADASPRDAGADGGTPVVTTDAGPESCPAAVPAEGSPCSFLGLTCQPGPEAEARDVCRFSFYCLQFREGWPDGNWRYQPGAGCGNDLQACLSESEMRAGAACTVGGLGRGWCTIPTGICWCRDGRYVCNNPTATPGCPPYLPLLGAPCATEGVTCTYNATPERVCRRGLWRGA